MTVGRNPVRWGILATGEIAHSFSTDLSLLDSAEIVAVGSRSASSAEAFSAEFGTRNRHGSYQDLVKDLRSMSSTWPRRIPLTRRRADGHRGRQGGPVREAVHDERRGGGGGHRGGAIARDIPDGGDVAAFPSAHGAH